MEKEQRDVLNRFLADNPELEQLSSRLDAFNIFRSLRIEDVEIRHSNVLAWLLDPAESHGMDDIFLRRILSNLLLERDAEDTGPTSAQVELMNFVDVEVRREWRNIDILVIDRGNEFVLLIENKVKSGEGAGQLSRYSKLVSQEFPSFTLVPIYLTLDGQASDDDGAQHYISYSHAQVLSVLDRIFEQRRGQMPDAVATLLSHYMDTVRRLTMQDKALAELCQKIYRKHKQAVDLIVEYGQASNFEQIAIAELQKSGQLEILHSSPSWIWFMPNSWAKVVPENGTAPKWRHLTRPVSVACWLRGDSDKLKLVFEVSRMKDSLLRMECVHGLKLSGFKPKKMAFRDDAMYSRFFNLTERISDKTDDEEIKSAIEKIISKAKGQFPKAESALRKVFER